MRSKAIEHEERDRAVDAAGRQIGGPRNRMARVHQGIEPECVWRNARRNPPTPRGQPAALSAWLSGWLRRLRGLSVFRA
jgi:uncharacterized protein with HEPN domain